MKIVPVLTTSGVWIKYDPKKHSKYINKIKELFTLEYVGFNNVISIVRGYKFYPPSTLILPKFGLNTCLNDYNKSPSFNALGITKFNNIVNIIPSIKNQSFEYLDSPKDMAWTGKLNQYQQIVKNEIMNTYFSSDNVKKGLAGVTLSLPTGHGKTFLAMALISELKLPTLVVCSRKKIVSQWVALLTNYFPNVEIGIYHSDSKKDGDIVVGVIDSLVNTLNFTMSNPLDSSKIEYDRKKFYNRWRLIIFDESHNYCTKQNSKIFSRMSPNYTLGLSATPYNRKDGSDIISHWNIGSVLTADDIPSYLETYKEEKTVPVFKGNVIGVKYYGPSDYTKNIHNKNGTIIAHKMMEMIISDPYRVKLIVKKLHELYDKDYCILVFADRISYLEQIKKALDEPKTQIIRKNVIEQKTTTEKKLESIILDLFKLKQDHKSRKIKEDQQIITGGATDQEMSQAYVNSKIILTTYAFFMEGISIPRINAILYATPRKSGIKQSNGRCLRPSNNENKEQKRKENSKERIIVDIIDWNIGFTKAQWYKRKRIYSTMDSMGADFDIINEDADYKDFIITNK